MRSGVTTLNKRGKRTKEWLRTRRAWINLNPPDHAGYYACGICGKAVHISDVEIDHINARSGSPESLSDFSNLQPSHSFCNRMKGSKRMNPLISAKEYEFRRKLDL